MIVYRELKSVQEDLGIPLKTLFALSNNLEKHYKIAYIPKKDGTQRKLCVPDYILKKAQRAIADVILSGYSVSRFACGYVYNKSILHNALPHVGKARILKLDIDGFLSEVNGEIVFCEELSDSVNYYCTADLPYSVELYGREINLHICVRDDGVAVGSPIIFGGY